MTLSESPARGQALLSPGIGVNLLGPSCTRAAVSLSPGVEPLPGQKHPRVRAMVPRPEWRPLEDREWVALHDGRSHPVRESLTFFDLDEAVLARTQESLLPWLQDPPGGRDETTGRAVAVTGARDDIVDHLALRYGIGCRSRGATDVVVHVPGRRSTAYNYDERIFMGLHLDNHQNYAFSQRRRSHLLMGVNLGLTERFFHVVPLPTTSLVKRLREAGVAIPGTTHELKNTFFAAFPDEPVLRLTLNPGQGYLANAHDLLHDGATNDSGVPDINMLSTNDFADTAPTPVR